MTQRLLCRFPVDWPPGCDRRALVDRIVGRQVARWSQDPADQPGVWLSDRVLEVRIAPVTVWVVLTEAELSLFWNAPLVARLFLTASRQQDILDAVQRDVAAALAA